MAKKFALFDQPLPPLWAAGRAEEKTSRVSRGRAQQIAAPTVPPSG